MSQNILNNLQKFITQKGWSKAEFARRMGIYAQDVNRYFEGKLDIQKLLIKLCSEGCDINWLLSDNCNSTPIPKADNYIQRIGRMSRPLMNKESDNNQVITEQRLLCPHCNNPIKITIEKG